MNKGPHKLRPLLLWNSFRGESKKCLRFRDEGALKSNIWATASPVLRQKSFLKSRIKIVGNAG